MSLPKVAVITPFYEIAPAYLARCVESVASQTYPCTHIVVGDGARDETFAPLAFGRDVEVFRLPVPHADFGDTPRLFGTISAFRRGFDAVCWLDADNWYAPGHVASLVGLHAATGSAVCTSSRVLCRVDGTVLGDCPETRPDAFIDTSCYFLTRAAREALGVYVTMEDEHHTIGDRVFFWELQKRGIAASHTYQRTVFYRTTYLAHYEYFGVAPPEGAKRGAHS